MSKIEIFFNIFVKHFHNSALVLTLAVIGGVFWFFKGNKKKRAMILVGVGIALVIGYNPFVFILMEKVGEASSYYRLLWGWPIVIFAGYAVFLIQKKSRPLEWIILIGLICIIFSIFIKKDDLVLPDNIGKLNRNLIEIADAIELDKEYEEVRFVGDSVCTYGMREYNANILLPFGEALVTSVKYDITLFEMINRGTEITNIAQFEDLLYIYKVDYFAVKKEYISMNETIQQMGKEIVYTNDEYILYKNENYEHDVDDAIVSDESIGEMVKNIWGKISSVVIIAVLFLIRSKMKKERESSL